MARVTGTKRGPTIVTIIIEQERSGPQEGDRDGPVLRRRARRTIL
jgi:hypothetical protein